MASRSVALQPHPPGGGGGESSAPRLQEREQSDIQPGLHSAQAFRAEMHSGTLHTAAAAGDLATMQRILGHLPVSERQAVASALDTDGLTPLHYAACIGHASCVSLLLRCGGDASARAPDTGQTPMLAATAHGHAALLPMFFACGAGPTHPAQKDALHHTALHIAAQHDRRDCARALLQRTTAFVRSKSADGSLPIHLAAARGSAGVMEELLAAGDARTLGLDTTDESGRTPFCLAAARLHEQCLDMLLRAGADPSTAGWGTLHMAVFEDNVCELDDVDLRTEDSQGLTAVHVAAGLGRVKALQELLDRAAGVKAARLQRRCDSLISNLCGADTDASNPHLDAARHLSQCPEATAALAEELSWDHSKLLDHRSGSARRTPLHVAAHGGRVDACLELLARGADHTAVDAHLWTPLHFAADAGSCTTVKVLLNHAQAEHRAGMLRAQAADPEEATPLCIGAQQGHLSVCEELLECARECQLSPLATQAEFIAAVDCVEVLRLLCEEAPDLASSQTGVDALVLSLRRGRVGSVCLLLDAGVLLSARLVDEVVSSALPPQRRAQALHFLLQHVRPTPKATVTAAGRGDTACVMLLLASQADLVDAVWDSRTPLQAALDFARQSANPQSLASTVQTLLMRFGADPTVAGSGLPPSICLAVNGADVFVRSLLQSGASTNHAVVLPDDPQPEEEEEECDDEEDEEQDTDEDGAAPRRRVRRKAPKPPPAQRLKISPLADAAAGGSLSLVKMLLKGSAAPDGTGDVGCASPLLAACQGKHWKCASAMLRAGAKPNIFGEEGAGPLWWALRSMRDPVCLRFVEELIDEFSPPPQQTRTTRRPPLTMRGARLRAAAGVTEVMVTSFAVLQVSATESAQAAVRMLLATAGQPRAKGAPTFRVDGSVYEGTPQVLDAIATHAADISAFIFTDSQSRAGAVAEELRRRPARTTRNRPQSVRGPRACVLWRQEADPREVNCCV